MVLVVECFRNEIISCIHKSRKADIFCSLVIVPDIKYLGNHTPEWSVEQYLGSTRRTRTPMMMHATQCVVQVLLVLR